jgi:hypothetical protein
MIELFLSSDGKHTVHVSSETAREMRKLMPKAKEFYEAIVATYGTKARMWQQWSNGNGSAIVNANGNGGGNGKAPQQAKAAEVNVMEVPRCPVHKTPMCYRQGRYGAFWSCPRRMPDGSWCECTFDVNTQQHRKKGAA